MGEIIMRLVGSFAFLFGALSVGALAYFPAAISHNEGPFGRFPAAPGADAVSATSTSAASRAANRDGDAARSFSPAPSVFEQLTAAFALSPSPAQPSRQISKPVETAASGTGAAWRTNVTTSSSDATGSTVAASTQPDDYMARYHLARSLQTELKRVGCYSGNVDGDWGPASKRAVFQFLEKVNATLPVDNPDYILLTLVQGHVDRACGLDCPAGQGLSAGGRCIPTVIVAQGPEQGSLLGRKALSAAPKLTSNSAKAALDRSDRPWESRIAADRSPPAPTQTKTPPPARHPAALERENAQDPPAPATSASHQPGRTLIAAIAEPDDSATATTPDRRPLPGRMAVGAPLPSQLTPPSVSHGGVSIVPPAAGNMGATAQQARRPQPPSPGAVAQLDLQPAPPLADFAATPPSNANRHGATRGNRQAVARPRSASRPKAARAPTYGYGRKGMVRTYSGKVRRGSPQHNLMLSLGGVF